MAVMGARNGSGTGGMVGPIATVLVVITVWCCGGLVGDMIVVATWSVGGDLNGCGSGLINKLKYVLF